MPQDKEHKISPEQMAYGLLWRSVSSCTLTHFARQILRDALDRDEQKQAIAWVLSVSEPMTDAEMIAADIRVGAFPHRSAPDDAKAEKRD